MSHGKARDRVHKQGHVFALVAEIFGDGCGHPGALQADERRLVRRGHDDDRALQAFRPEIALDELLDLAAALANEGDDAHVG